MLIFSALNHSSSHHCGFELSSLLVLPNICAVIDPWASPVVSDITCETSQVLLAGGQVFFLRDCPFLPHLND